MELKFGGWGGHRVATYGERGLLLDVAAVQNV